MVLSSSAEKINHPVSNGLFRLFNIENQPEGNNYNFENTLSKFIFRSTNAGDCSSKERIFSLEMSVSILLNFFKAKIRVQIARNSYIERSRLLVTWSFFGFSCGKK